MKKNPTRRSLLATFTDRELAHMIRVTKGAQKEMYLKEAGRRVAATFEKRHGKTRKNPPPLYGSTKRALKSGKPGTMIGIKVYEVRYRHASDGKDYTHKMSSDDAIMIGLADGSILIESASGKRLWNLFDV